ncbi:hypothetical protein PQX77_020250 [Marasmius sp. AFHP31]|nr:hypothetical protein PQX77_020250 [Marasmius sp. AFHP31]
MGSKAGLGTKNITYDDRDVKNLEYNGYGWVLNGTWNAINGQSGTLSSSNGQDAIVTFNFPEPAIAFYYYGILRSRGGLYSICIDCGSNYQHLQTIDGLNITDDDAGLSLDCSHSKVSDIPAKHVVILRNQNDTRIRPRGNSQITVDRFVLQVVDDSPIPVTPSASPFSMSDAVKPGPSIGALVGGALGGGLLLVVVLTVIGLYWMRRRERSDRILSTHYDINTDTSETDLFTILPYCQMHAFIPKEGRPKAGSLRPPHPPQPQSSPITTSSSSTIAPYFYFRRLGRRREVDAGPAHLEEGDSNLPPSYEQVLEAGASNHPLPSGQVPHGHKSRPTAPDTDIMQSTAK